MRSAGQNAASAPSGRARAECGTVPPEMETCARLSTHRPGLFRAAICIGKEVRIGSRGKRAKAARAEATDNLNVSTRIHALYLRPPRHDDPDDDGRDDDGNDQSHQRVNVHQSASQTCCCLNSGSHPLTLAFSAIQACMISGPTTPLGARRDLPSDAPIDRLAPSPRGGPLFFRSGVRTNQPSHPLLTILARAFALLGAGPARRNLAGRPGAH
jgi:hypothetical protein